LSRIRIFSPVATGDKIAVLQSVHASLHAAREFLSFLEVVVTHTIRFRRPETGYSISRMFVSGEASADVQVRHLEGLGYTVVDVAPALVGQYMLQFPERQVPSRP
jgi:hypothetical protein